MGKVNLGRFKSKPTWPYKQDSPHDPEYVFDKTMTLLENGNGWWIKQRAKVDKTVNGERKRSKK